MDVSRCAAGDMHIWERESGIVLHEFRAQDHNGDLTCIAWNHASDAHMFATGSHDGGVRIWTTTNQNQYLTIPTNGQRASISSTPGSVTPPPFLPENNNMEYMDSPVGQEDFDFPFTERTDRGDRNSQYSRRAVVVFNAGTSSASRR